jgi:hypothetical protein
VVLAETVAAAAALECKITRAVRVFLRGLAVPVVTLGALAVLVLLQTTVAVAQVQAAAAQATQMPVIPATLHRVARRVLLELGAAPTAVAGALSPTRDREPVHLPPAPVVGVGPEAGAEVRSAAQPVVVVVVVVEGVLQMREIRATRGLPQTQQHLTP